MEMMVEEDLEKTLHSVMALWTNEDDAKNKEWRRGTRMSWKNFRGEI